MADADELFRRLPPTDGEAIALVPNMRGAERAIAAGVRHARLLISCSEGHSKANTNRSVDEGLGRPRGGAGTAARRGRARHRGHRHRVRLPVRRRSAAAPGRPRGRRAGAHGADRDQPLRHPGQGRSGARRAGGGRDALGVPGRHLRPAPAQHLRHGAGQRRGGPRAGDRAVRRRARRHRRLPVRPGRGGQHRNGGRGLHARLDGSAGPGSTWTGWARPPGSCGPRWTARWSRPSRVRWGGRHERAGGRPHHPQRRRRHPHRAGPRRPVRDRRRDHPDRRRPPAADGCHRRRRGRQAPAAGIIDPHVHLGIGPGAGRDKLVRDFESRVGRRGRGRRHDDDHDHAVRHRVARRGGRGRHRHRQPALAGGLPAHRRGDHPRAPHRGRRPGQARAAVVQVLPRLQGRAGRGLRHERRRHLVGLLLPGLRGARGGRREGVPDRPRRGPVGAGLPHRAAARLRARTGCSSAGWRPARTSWSRCRSTPPR